MNLDHLSIRELQKESARAIVSMDATNEQLHPFNVSAPQNSELWYRTVIQWYISKYGDLPSKIGPGKEVILISEE